MIKSFSLRSYVVLTLALLGIMLLCLCVGSVSLPVKETLSALWNALWGQTVETSFPKAILFSVRLPRVVCVALTGAALSLCGVSMQGLLRNPLADGSTLGVSSGASLGAVLALAFPGLSQGGVMICAMLFAFLSLMLILSLSYMIDRTLSTNSLILIGVIFSMFASSLISLVITFAGDRIKSITFWTMGSLSGSRMDHAAVLGSSLFVCAAIILLHTQELNAFAIGEDNARHIGVNVRRTKLLVLICASILIGVCVSIGGTIGFVGLVVPHMARMVAGPNHRQLLPASLYFGAIFLLLTDLASRTLLRPVELPIGVVTSLIGAVLFMVLFYRNQKEAHRHAGG